MVEWGATPHLISPWASPRWEVVWLEEGLSPPSLALEPSIIWTHWGREDGALPLLARSCLPLKKYVRNIHSPSLTCVILTVPYWAGGRSRS